jgi:cell division protein FtsB
VSRGSKTSSIPRSPARKQSLKSSKKRGAAPLSDLTRPTPRAERLIPKVFGRSILVIGVALVLISFGNSFVLLPAQSWLGQKDEISFRQEELEVIKRATDQLQIEIDQMQTPRGIEQAARSELGYVMRGEKRQILVGSASAPIDLPAGWPYDLVSRIMVVKTIEAEANQPG